MISDLRTALEAAGADGPTIQLIRSVLSALPPEAHLEGRGGLAGLFAEPVTERVIREDIDSASAASDIAAALDRGELLSAAAVGPRVALSLYDAHLEWALGVGDLEREQSRDAALKLHGIGLLAQRLFKGSIPERAGEMLSYEAGRALLVWFIAVEVVLAVSTEDEQPTIQHLRDLIDQHGESVIQDLNHLASRADREGGQEVIKAMFGVISPVVQAAAESVPGLAGAVRRSLPELPDNGRDALTAETQTLGVYTVLVARLVAEIEAERLQEALPPPPPPAPEIDPEREAAQARLAEAQDRWDPGPLADAAAKMVQIDSGLADLKEREDAHKKLLRAAKRKLSRTVDRRARIAEAPPAGQAEAEAAAERAAAALQAAHKAVKKAGRQLGTSEEGVVAAKAGLKRWDKTLAQRRGEEAEAQAAVESLQTTVSKLQDKDESQIEKIRKAEVAQEAAEAQAVVDMGARLEEARARMENIEQAVPESGKLLGRLDEQLMGIRASFSDVAGNREALADALVLAREAQPEQQAARKDKAAVAAQAVVRRDALAARLADAAKVLKAAQSAVKKADKVAGRVRDKMSVADEKAQHAATASDAAAAKVSVRENIKKQTGLALRANEEAMAASVAAAAAARGEACAALGRALELARERQTEMNGRGKAIDEAMSSIAQRDAAQILADKDLGMRRDALVKAIELARARRDARVSLSERQQERVAEQGASLSSREKEMAGLVKASRKTGAAHAGAAARVVGARDALIAANSRVSDAESTRDRCVEDVAQLDARVKATQTEMAAMDRDISTLSEAPVQDPLASEPSEIDALLAELKPTLMSQTGETLRPATTWDDGPPEVDDAPPEVDDAATAMFTPKDLQARMQQEQAEEEAANATLMFNREARPDESEEDAEDEEEAATTMFSVEELRARAQAEMDEDDSEDDATVIFQRPVKPDEES